MKNNTIKINESTLNKIVLNCVKKVLKEAYEHGIDADDAVSGSFENTPEKGKNYFANNGIVNFKWNNEGAQKVYLTTSFLGNRRLSLKLGARWATASKKSYFNRYSVDSDAVLVIVNDTKNGNAYQIQYTANGPQLATDKMDQEVDVNMFKELNNHIRSYFPRLLEMTKKMCSEEDAYFASKTSKSFESLKESSKMTEIASDDAYNKFFSHIPRDEYKKIATGDRLTKDQIEKLKKYKKGK